MQPRWMWYVLPNDPVPFARFGVRVMGIKPAGNILGDAQAGVKALCEWLDRVGLFLTLEDLGIEDGETLERAAEDCVRLYGGDGGALGGVKPLSREDVLAIYRMCGIKDFMK